MLISRHFHAAGLGLRDTSWIIIVNSKFPPCHLKNKPERTQYLIQNQPIKIYCSLCNPTKIPRPYLCLNRQSYFDLQVAYHVAKISVLAVIKSLEWLIYSQTKNLYNNDFNRVKNYSGSRFSHIIKKLPKTSCVLTIAVYLVRSSICLFAGMVRINFFDCTCLHFDGYKYFVEHVNCSPHRPKESKVSYEHRFITFSWAVETPPTICSKHFSGHLNGTMYSGRYHLNERAYV